MSESIKSAINKMIPTTWSRNTVADGSWLQKNTLSKLKERDDTIADMCDEQLAEVTHNISTVQDKINEHTQAIETINDEIDKLHDEDDVLQGEIDVLKAASDVVEVVANNEDFAVQHASIESWVTDHDIVKILSGDNGEQTYIRYLTGGAGEKQYKDYANWELVGTLAAYYSQEEMDDKLSKIKSYYSFSMNNDDGIENETDVALGYKTSAFGYNDSEKYPDNPIIRPAVAIGYNTFARTINDEELDKTAFGMTFAMGYDTSAYGHNQYAFGYKAYAGGLGGNFLLGNYWDKNIYGPFSDKLNKYSYYGSYGKANENLIHSSVVATLNATHGGYGNHNIALDNSLIENANHSFVWKSAIFDENTSSPTNMSENIVLQNSMIFGYGSYGLHKNHLECNAVLSGGNNGLSQNYILGGFVSSDKKQAHNNVVFGNGEGFNNYNLSDIKSQCNKNYNVAIYNWDKWDYNHNLGSFDAVPTIIDSEKSFIIHDNWVYNSVLTTILGENNLVQNTTTNTIIGNGNVVKGYLHNNNRDSTTNFIIGYGNQVAPTVARTTTSNFIIGQNNLITSGNNIFDIGVGNQGIGDDIYNIGLGLIGNSYQVVVGKYNKPIEEFSNRFTSLDNEKWSPSAEAIFIVGNGQNTGTDEFGNSSYQNLPMTRNEDVINRSNAMVVYQDGHAEFTGDVIGHKDGKEYKLSDVGTMYSPLSATVKYGTAQVPTGTILTTSYDFNDFNCYGLVKHSFNEDSTTLDLNYTIANCPRSKSDYNKITDLAYAWPVADSTDKKIRIPYLSQYSVDLASGTFTQNKTIYAEFDRSGVSELNAQRALLQLYENKIEAIELSAANAGDILTIDGARGSMGNFLSFKSRSELSIPDSYSSDFVLDSTTNELSTRTKAFPFVYQSSSVLYDNNGIFHIDQNSLEGIQSQKNFYYNTAFDTKSSSVFIKTWALRVAGIKASSNKVSLTEGAFVSQYDISFDIKCSNNDNLVTKNNEILIGRLCYDNDNAKNLCWYQTEPSANNRRYITSATNSYPAAGTCYAIKGTNTSTTGVQCTVRVNRNDGTIISYNSAKEELAQSDKSAGDIYVCVGGVALYDTLELIGTVSVNVVTTCTGITII